MKTSAMMILSAMVLFLLAAVGLSALSASAEILKTEDAVASEVQGTYTLILYGGRYSSDLQTVAILAREGTGYAFEPYAPEFDYRVIQGVPAKEALSAAESFVRNHPSAYRSQLARILGPGGEVLGYELRPLYFPLDFGVTDVLDVTYWLTDRKVVVRVHLIPSVEMMLRDGGGVSREHK